MTKTEIDKLFEVGKKILDYYGSPFDIKIGNAKRSWGCCNYIQRTIKISSWALQNESYEECYQTLIHEIAHALNRIGEGHGYEWKTTCQMLGLLNPQRGRATEKEIDYGAKYLLVCKSCGWKRERFRRPKRTNYSCPICDAKYNPKYKLEFIERR